MSTWRSSTPDQERIEAWKERTPQVLQEAMRAAFTREGCTPAQKRLLKNWVTATVNDSPLATSDLLRALRGEG